MLFLHCSLSRATYMYVGLANVTKRLEKVLGNFHNVHCSYSKLS